MNQDPHPHWQDAISGCTNPGHSFRPLEFKPQDACFRSGSRCILGFPLHMDTAPTRDPHSILGAFVMTSRLPINYDRLDLDPSRFLLLGCDPTVVSLPPSPCDTCDLLRIGVAMTMISSGTPYGFCSPSPVPGPDPSSSRCESTTAHSYRSTRECTAMMSHLSQS